LFMSWIIESSEGLVLVGVFIATQILHTFYRSWDLSCREHQWNSTEVLQTLNPEPCIDTIKHVLIIAGEQRLWSKNWVFRDQAHMTWNFLLNFLGISWLSSRQHCGNKSSHTGGAPITMLFASSSPQFVHWYLGPFSGTLARKGKAANFHSHSSMLPVFPGVLYHLLPNSYMSCDELTWRQKDGYTIFPTCVSVSQMMVFMPFITFSLTHTSKIPEGLIVFTSVLSKLLRTCQ
jgi:hypothetical protein